MTCSLCKYCRLWFPTKMMLGAGLLVALAVYGSRVAGALLLVVVVTLAIAMAPRQWWRL